MGADVRIASVLALDFDAFRRIGCVDESACNRPSYVQSGTMVPVQVYRNPLVNLVWIGVAVMMIGGVVAVFEKSQLKKRETQNGFPPNGLGTS